MSEAPRDPHPPLEPDRLPMVRIGLAGAGALLAIALAIAVAAGWTLRPPYRVEPPARATQPSGRMERISGVLQTRIAPDDTGRPSPLGAPPARFEWIDRSEGWLRIPVEEAIAWVVEEAR